MRVRPSLGYRNTVILCKFHPLPANVAMASAGVTGTKVGQYIHSVIRDRSISNSSTFQPAASAAGGGQTPPDCRKVHSLPFINTDLDMAGRWREVADSALRPCLGRWAGTATTNRDHPPPEVASVQSSIPITTSFCFSVSSYQGDLYLGGKYFPTRTIRKAKKASAR